MAISPGEKLLAESGIDSFLHCETPASWLSMAVESLPLLLVDHANCEKKAASTALNLLYRYTGNTALLNKLSRLAREELRHFEQVVAQMQRLGIPYGHVGASRYAGELHKAIAASEPHKLVDTLIVGAYIEARSCERFCRLVPLLEPVDKELASFYASLLKSEARHYRDYLKLAEDAAKQSGIGGLVAQKVEAFGEREAGLVLSGDKEFRFHSGVPACSGLPVR